MAIDYEGRVRALLDRAEHPETPEAEAQACAAKAAELMMRHAIDEAAVRAARGETPEPVVYWEHTIAGDDGHAQARSAGLSPSSARTAASAPSAARAPTGRTSSCSPSPPRPPATPCPSCCPR